MSHYQCISLPEAEQMLREKEMLILDMRDFQSYSVSHYPKALHLDDTNLRMLIKHTNRDVPVLIYCYHGHASQNMAQLFADVGFKHCFSLDGGFEAWFQSVKKPKLGLSAELRAWLRDFGFDGDNLDRRSRNNDTALMAAARFGASDFVAELIAAGASVNLVNKDGNNALWMATDSNCLNCIRHLIAAGIAIDNQNDNGATALMYAASTGKSQVVRLLVNVGANAFLTTLDDFAAIDVAETPEIYRFLKTASC